MLFKSSSLFALSLCACDAACQITKTINWSPCTQNGTLPIECGTLTVPLDYVNTNSTATLDLQLVKLSAVKRPKKGSILFNPGGPGIPGRDFIAGSVAPSLLIATGGYHDLIGFDPRYAPPLQRHCLAPLLNSSDTAIGSTWAAKTVFAETCYKNAREIGELVGTGYVARDMMQIVDALGEDGLLRFWGFSYGTALGETVAAMFPHRMDKVVLDGCLNPHLYYAGIDVEGVTDSDKSFDGFFTGCVAHPEACKLARDGLTPADLKQEFYDVLYSLKYEPYVARIDGNATVLDYNVVKGIVLSALYSTSTWPILAAGLHGLVVRNDTELAALVSLQLGIPGGAFPNEGPEAYLGGIRASDVRFRSNNLTSLYPLLEQFFAKSQILGDVLSANLLTYAQWPFRAKGGYTGDFRVKTKHPILFVGSDRDALTPLVSAQNASADFEGSVVLQHGGYGHTSLGQPSLCTAKTIRAYFVNGTLPAPGTKCEPTFGLFSSTTAEQELAPIANFTKRTLGRDEGDEDALLSAMVRLSTWD
ncbi:MAG: hypothetical protein Q9198_002705 [Flavoplaca austrocitrina]